MVSPERKLYIFLRNEIIISLLNEDNSFLFNQDYNTVFLVDGDYGPFLDSYSRRFTLQINFCLFVGDYLIFSRELEFMCPRRT